MKYEKFFELAKAKGIENTELFIRKSYSLSVSLFHGEVDNFSSNNGFSVIARGLINGKFGAATCDVWDEEKAIYLIDSIVKNAKVIENNDPQFIFEGSPKYKKINTFNKDLAKISLDVKLAKLHELEEKIKAYDEKIHEIEGVYYDEVSEDLILMNSKGLKLTQKSNYYAYVGVAVAKYNGQVKTNMELLLDNNFDKADMGELAKKVARGAVEQLSGEPCESGNYQAVLSPDVVSSLLRAYIGSADAEEVQKNSSLFKGKLGQKIASSKVTVEDRPLDKTLFAKGFDDEGVATYNKHIIKSGTLETYLYNLTTGAKDGVGSTANAVRYGSKIGTAPTFLVFKPGKHSQEDLFKAVGNGVYITEVSGLHAGLNPQSGNFSLQSSGFLIKDGKKDRPLDIITISGNLLKLFQDITMVGNDVKVFLSATSCPSVIIKKIAVSGK